MRSVVPVAIWFLSEEGGTSISTSLSSLFYSTRTRLRNRPRAGTTHFTNTHSTAMRPMLTIATPAIKKLKLNFSSIKFGFNN